MKIEKQLYGYFKRQTGEIALEKTWKWLRKRNLMKENEFLLIAVHFNSSTLLIADNANSTDKRKDLLLTNKPRIVP